MALFSVAFRASAQNNEQIVNVIAGVSNEVLTDTGKRPRQEMPASQQSLLELGLDRVSDFSSFVAIIERYYGVDRELLFGIWGIETRFGTNVGTAPIGSALRKFAAENPSKRAFASQQLRAATRLVNKGVIDPNDLVGSYAGALGQTQFIPTSYEGYAVDGDGNGTVDLWTAKDALASTANYMRAMGWHKGQPWGLAVEVPEGFYDSDANRRRRDMNYWFHSGIKPKFGRELPKTGFARVERYLGADYILFDNFYSILKYNNAYEYAFSVVALGDQVVHPDREGSKEIGDKINAGANIQAKDTPAAKPKGPCKSKVCGVQIKLRKLGYYQGDIDGEYGPGTKNAIGRFLRDNPKNGAALLR